MPTQRDLPNIAAPATQALATAGITSLDDLADRDVDALIDLHGVGPKAIRMLKAALSATSTTPSE